MRAARILPKSHKMAIQWSHTSQTQWLWQILYLFLCILWWLWILSKCSKCIFEEKLERAFRVKETRIITQQRCFFRTVVHHFYVLLAFCIKSLLLDPPHPQKNYHWVILIFLCLSFLYFSLYWKYLVSEIKALILTSLPTHLLLYTPTDKWGSNVFPTLW